MKTLDIKDGKILVEGFDREIDKINMINLSREYLSFSSKISDSHKYNGDINSVYQLLIDANIKGLLLQGNNIINLNNVVSLYIDYYQYAGISIHKSSMANAEMCLLTLVCKDGKKESIPFRTHKEAEKCYHEIDGALSDLRNKEVMEGLLNN